MNASDRFLRFAAECEVMAKFTRSPQSKAVWTGLAQRWLRCAELMDHEREAVHQANPPKRHRTSLRNLAH